eukprot:CAMPEP_0181220748 /NCGR_PEP_ID=MMETSP1096-20121128/29005_1 /TAXON_ID=156174 ORGANISM="Chrysochromulina ericina, Strain CCMP281" /NCGR_SAMPLE_ID=MMETSP1096 /ASSEMBLY_ACC=CAM_ASM_000453 /LENGTH=214 /DNA_ID=CAMNT_0023313277 /DNA_START=68 /DNA_END=709 /DNA_ORIENTATION=+
MAMGVRGPPRLHAPSSPCTTALRSDLSRAALWTTPGGGASHPTVVHLATCHHYACMYMCSLQRHSNISCAAALSGRQTRRNAAFTSRSIYSRRPRMIMVRVEGGDLDLYSNRSTWGSLAWRSFTSLSNSFWLLISKTWFSVTTSVVSATFTDSKMTPMLVPEPIIGWTLHSSQHRLAKSDSTNSIKTRWMLFPSRMCTLLGSRVAGTGATTGPA